MKELHQSKELAEAMVKIGKNLGRNTTAVISDMNQPLGFMVGNALEVKEAIDTLKGEGPDDLTELCYTLGSHMAVLANKADSTEEARQLLKEAVESGKALEHFKLFIRSQGGDADVVDHPEQLPTASNQVKVVSDEDGFISRIIADEIGTAAMLLGAGRATKDSVIDLAVGIELHKKIGDEVKAGEALATLHVNGADAGPVVEKVKGAYTVTKDEVIAPQLVYDVIR